MPEPAFTKLTDLAAERLGGKALLCTDDFFAEKENLLKSGRGIFIPDKYTDRGKWMDGWESRRKRGPGHDWCIIQLATPGKIYGMDIDTNHFLGNHPPYASVEAINVFTMPVHELEKAQWKEILAKSQLEPGSQNFFEIEDKNIYTHLRLNIYPDGGVARLKVYGEVFKDWELVDESEAIDLAAATNGAKSVLCNDMFFSHMDNLIMPSRGVNMGDGWETKRRRGPGYDWIILKLGRPGTIRKVEVDTNHFKGNFPDMCSIEGCAEPDASDEDIAGPKTRWSEILSQTKLKADTRHFFEKELSSIDRCSHVRLNIYPDGGVSRLRVWGTVA